jgi:hypothetical protein
MNFKKYFSILFCIIICIFFSIESTFAKEELSEQAQRIQDHIKYLASDELEGRFPGTPGIEKAKEYILNYYKSIGLKEVNQSHFQNFDMSVGCELGKLNNVYFNFIIPKPGIPIELVKPVKKQWKTNEDWMPVALSDNGTIEAGVVFAGYGITAKDLKYDDYATVEVKDKIVIVLSNSPDCDKNDGEFAGYVSYN